MPERTNGVIFVCRVLGMDAAWRPREDCWRLCRRVVMVQTCDSSEHDCYLHREKSVAAFRSSIPTEIDAH